MSKILDLMDYERIFSITPLCDGSFEVQESCDRYFEVTLSKEQLLKLGEEIIEMANTGFKE